MIKHAAKVTAINPSARFAHEEMFGFVLVRISVLGNIFSARDLHSSLFNFCFPQRVFAMSAQRSVRALLRARMRRRFEIYARTP
jgi:hypothetical protein